MRTTRTRQLPASEWPAFFHRLSRDHLAWRASVHGMEDGRLVTCVPSAALKSVTLDSRASDQVLRLNFLNGVSLCAPRLRDVRVEETEEGVPSAVELETADGGFIRMAFRAAALPDQLDGIAPGEAIVGAASRR